MTLRSTLEIYLLDSGAVHAAAIAGLLLLMYQLVSFEGAVIVALSLIIIGQNKPEPTVRY